MFVVGGVSHFLSEEEVTRTLGKQKRREVHPYTLVYMCVSKCVRVGTYV